MKRWFGVCLVIGLFVIAIIFIVLVNLKINEVRQSQFGENPKIAFFSDVAQPDDNAKAIQQGSVSGIKDKNQMSTPAHKILGIITGGSSGEALNDFDPTRLWNASLPLKIRRQIAWDVVRRGNSSDFNLVTEYLTSQNGDPFIQEYILELLGSSSHPGARDLILPALKSDNERMVRSALRGLAKLNNSKDINLFDALFLSKDTSIGIRTEAATSLGMNDSPKAAQKLISAYNRADPDDELIRELAIEGLGRRDIAETEVFFRQILSVETNSDLRVSIFEAISDAKGNIEPFLKDFINDNDSDVREEVVWNLGMLEGNHGKLLCEHLNNETDPEVRKRIYEALDEQDSFDISLVLQESLQDTDLEAQLASYTLIAAHLNQIKDPDERESAELVITGELEQMAVDGVKLNQRLRAVIGLRRMKTDGSSEALMRIVGRSDDPRVIMATGVDLNGNVTDR
jgi:hypothetical protein